MRFDRGAVAQRRPGEHTGGGNDRWRSVRLNTIHDPHACRGTGRCLPPKDVSAGAPRRNAEGTPKGLGMPRQFATEGGGDKCFVENVNKINDLDSSAWLRTKGSWVRILPAAPKQEETDQRVRCHKRLTRFSLSGGLLGDSRPAAPPLVPAAAARCWRGFPRRVSKRSVSCACLVLDEFHVFIGSIGCRGRGRSTCGIAARQVRRTFPAP